MDGESSEVGRDGEDMLLETLTWAENQTEKVVVPGDEECHPGVTLAAASKASRSSPMLGALEVERGTTAR